MKALGLALIECTCHGNFSFTEDFTGEKAIHSDINAFLHPEINMPSPAYVFSQLLDLLPRYEFQHIVNKYQGDYRCKDFKCWNQLAIDVETLYEVRENLDPDSLRVQEIDAGLRRGAEPEAAVGRVAPVLRVSGGVGGRHPGALAVAARIDDEGIQAFDPGIGDPGLALDVVDVPLIGELPGREVVGARGAVLARAPFEVPGSPRARLRIAEP